MTENIAIGSDHRGYALKEYIKAFLEKTGKPVTDKGTFTEASVDYPEFAAKVSRSVSTGECSRGILICGSGIGMSITANKFPGVRAALCHDAHSAEMSRRHNDANILILGESVGRRTAQKIIKVWFEIPFEGGRHQRRVDLINLIEKENFK